MNKNFRTKDVVSVNESFGQWLKLNQYEDNSFGFKIIENWSVIMGSTISNHTSKVDVKVPKVFLKLNNSSLKELLFHDKNLMIDKINEYLGHQIITEIIFT